MTLGILTSHHVTNNGGTGISHSWLLASSAMIMASALGSVVALGLIIPKLIRTRRQSRTQPRTLIIALACMIMLMECVNQARIIPELSSRSMDLVHYYAVRTASFILLGPCLTLTAVYRVLGLFSSAKQQTCILVLAYSACVVVVVGASLAMWDATLSVLAIGTMDAWHYQWVLPFYGTVVGSMVPLSNVVLCIMSLRTDLVDSGGRRSTGSQSSTEKLKNLASTGRLPGGTADDHPPPNTPGPSSTSNYLGAVRAVRSSDSVLASPRPLRAAVRPRSISDRLHAAYDAMVSPAAISLSRASWMLTAGQCACWTAFLCLGAIRAIRISQWSRNCLYDLLGAVILLLEASFERLYKFEYERAKSQTRLLTVTRFMALTKPGGTQVGRQPGVGVGGTGTLYKSEMSNDEYGGRSSSSEGGKPAAAPK